MTTPRDKGISRRQMLTTVAAVEAAALMTANVAEAQSKRTPSIASAAAIGQMVSIADTGAVGDGRHDDAKAIQAAIDKAAAAGGGTVYIPPGSYRVSGGIEPKSGVAVVGANMDTTRLNFDESAGSSCFVRSWEKPQIENVAFRDFTVVGPWADRPGAPDRRAFQIGAVSNLTFDNIGCRYIRGMSITCQDCRNVEISGCRIERSAIDGISAFQCENVRILGCTIRHVGDDAIAAHTGRHAKFPTPSGIVISGCVIEDAMGIKVLGAKSIAITGNVLRRCKGYGLWIGIHDRSYLEGFTSSHSVSITGNVILDVMNLAPFSGARLHDYVRIGSYAPSRGDGSVNAVPGRPDRRGRFVRPWDGPYLYDQGPGNKTAHAGGYNWVISGNVCARTLPSGKRYSSWGLGRAFMRKGWMDPRIAERHFRGEGIAIVDSLRQAVIANNLICTGSHGVYFVDGKQDHAFESIDIVQNNIVWAISGGLSSNFGADRSVTVRVTGNNIDCDPYHEHPARRSNGGWVGARSRAPAAVNATRMIGVEFSGNTVRNVYRPLKVSRKSVVHVANRNTLCCKPTATGVHQDNLGIHEIPRAGGEYIYLVEEADPRRASYGTIRNSNVLSATAQPRSGIYVQGHYVQNTNAAPDDRGRILMGWYRRTTGSSHVATVDWVAVWGSTAG